MRYLLVHREFGVYLGSCMGLGFWSKLDPVGQTCAPTFDSEDVARAHVDTWDFTPPKEDLTVLSVPVDTEYANIEQCAAAGAPRWHPNDVAGSC